MPLSDRQFRHIYQLTSIMIFRILKFIRPVKVHGERTAQPADTRPDPWLIHAELTSEQCVLAGRPVRLWREGTQGVRSTVLDVASGESAELEWSEGNLADWPLREAPGDNRIYLVRPADGLRSAAIKTHTLAAGLEDKGLTTVAWLAARGCIAQARLLMRTLPESEPPR